jgi:hypothetical protein
MLRRTRAALRFARRLPGFLSQTLGAAEARALVTARLAQRPAALLRILADAVFARPQSVYARLFANAGIALGDVAELVARSGVEVALERLHDAGVFVTLEEVKGRRVLRRGSLEIAVRAEDFDNPLLAASYEARSGGSRRAGTRVLVDLDLLAYEAAHQALYAEVRGLEGRVAAQWRPVPPGVAGINNALRSARIGQPLECWFSQTDPARAARSDAWLLRYLVHAGRGRTIPAPEHVPVDEAETVARWIAEVRARGRTALLDSATSGLVRVCTAAAAAGLDISGTALRFGGEPLTAARAAVLRDAGALALARYSMAEVGMMGVGCARPRAIDEVHLLSDKLAFIQRDRTVAADGRTVGALSITTLLPASPKILLNAEIDDYGVLDEHRCGCGFEDLGLRWHLHTIRSFEKLTSEGMSFLGADLLRLVENVLPARFGGDATRYQIVEEDRAGLPAVEIRVHPSVGAVDEDELVATALGALAAISPTHRMMAESWQRAETLRVVRAPPLVTAGAKILPLHVRRGGP